MGKSNSETMNREETVRKGEETAFKNHNQEGYQDTEKQGGEATSKNREQEFQGLGQQGREASTRNYGQEAYHGNEKQGDQATTKNHDREFDQEFGQKDGESRNGQGNNNN